MIDIAGDLRTGVQKLKDATPAGVLLGSGKLATELDRLDPLDPKIVRATASILERDKIVAPVELLVRMRLLAEGDLEDWRHGRVPYLERFEMTVFTPGRVGPARSSSTRHSPAPTARA